MKNLDDPAVLKAIEEDYFAFMLDKYHKDQLAQDERDINGTGECPVGPIDGILDVHHNT